MHPLLLLVFVFLLVLVLILLTYRTSQPKRPSQNLFSHLTALSFLYTRWNYRFRTKTLYLQHYSTPSQTPILLLSPKTLSFASIHAIKPIYGHSTPCLKSDMYSVQASGNPSILDVMDKEAHKRKRRGLAHVFAMQKVEGWEDRVRGVLGRLVDILDGYCGNEQQKGMVEMRKWLNLYTVDIIASITLSCDLGMLRSGNDTVTIENENGNIHEFNFIESLHGGNRAASLVVWASPWFHTLKYLTNLCSRYFRQQWQHGRNYTQIIRFLVRKRVERYQEGEKLDDFVAVLMKDKAGHPRGLERGEIEAETNVLMNAGSDTTAIALTNIFYYLLKNPSKLTKLREEIAGVLSGDEVVAPWTKVKNLRYLRACIDESLRLSPPVAFGLERRTPPEGMSIMGEWIAGDTVVSVPAYVAHRDPIIFPDPEEYRPERWIEDEEKVKEMRKYFIPFSTGARGCIGRNLAYLEQYVVVATLVHRYGFALPSKGWEMEWEEAFNLWPSEMPLKIWRLEPGKAGAV